ncbi:MAG: N-acetylmuramoyl-L-alanine amidase [Mediterranea massiliensis]|nr:N-acetylmuramoyl-L-alanine amidase [Mediterranea massiliensis]
MRSIRLIVIHCSATRANRRYTVDDCRRDHRDRGFADIGYHYYITRDGEVHAGRPLSQVGAHARGFNRYSIGICYEGGLDNDGRPADTRTPQQRTSLDNLLTRLKAAFPQARIVGHNQLNPHKACPCFEVVQ